MMFSSSCEWNLWRYPSYKTVTQKILRSYELAMLSWEHLQRIQWPDTFLETLSPLFVTVGETQVECLFRRSCGTSSSESAEDILQVTAPQVAQKESVKISYPFCPSQQNAIVFVKSVL